MLTKRLQHLQQGWVGLVEMAESERVELPDGRYFTSLAGIFKTSA